MKRPQPISGGGRLREAAGFSLVELLVSSAIMVTILGSTMMTMTQALRVNETALLVTGMNSTLRGGMDLMIRDLLQVGSGLPPGHVILTPSGAGSLPLRIPGPPGTAFLSVSGDPDLSAIVPGPGLGPVINGVPTDIITVLAADNTFTDVALTAVTSTSVDVSSAVNIASGPDRVLPGQLMMIEKGATTTLVQVTTVNTSTRRLTLASGDSLRLNQPAAAAGSLAVLDAVAPAATPPATSATRIRMVTYYLDASVAEHPRLVRRINNGHPMTFDNTLGTAVAIDVENLQFTYDLADGATNPANVRFTTADLAGSGACAPNPCSVNQIRKVNVVITARSKDRFRSTQQFFRNSLSSQVSLRGMAFVDEYLSP